MLFGPVLTEEDILQLHSAFSEAFKSITDFLNTLPSPLPPHNPLVVAIVRVLGAWLAEENLALTTELYQLLPKLLNMCGAHLQLAAGEGEGGERERGGTDDASVMENPLKFLLPGLSHLVADETPRAIMKTILPHLLLQYMTALYSSGSISLMR